MPIRTDRLWGRLEALQRITDPQRPWTRRSFTPLFAEGRAWLTDAFRAVGLETSVDAGGNLVGRRPGRVAGLAPLVSGSHSDTVPSGGRFDGVLGVAAALELAEALAEDGVDLRHPLEIVDFLAEEPSEFGLSCIGSRAWAGALGPEMLEARDPAGRSLADALRSVGGCPEELSQAVRPAGSIAAMVELHIEQGRVLQDACIPIGAVTDIVGIQRYGVTVEGRADHAGTTPMPVRRDALVGAVRVVEAVRRFAETGGPHYLVATVGRFDVWPNASNAVPGRVSLIMEARSSERTHLDRFGPSVEAAVAQELAGFGLTARFEPLSRAEPVTCAAGIRATVEAAAEAHGLDCLRLPSGAGHDSMWLSGCGPVGMIFVPCRDGRSHCPEEWLEPDQAADGARILYETIRRLDADLDR